MSEWVDLDVLRPCHTGGLTSNFAPGVGKLTVFNTWLVLSSPLCPGGGGPYHVTITICLLRSQENLYDMLTLIFYDANNDHHITLKIRFASFSR